MYGLKNLGTKIINKLGYLKNMAYLAIAGMVTTAVNPTNVYAKNGGMVSNAHADPEANNLVDTIIGTVVNIFPLIGAFFVVSGVFKLILAYRGDNPEAQTAAAKDIVIGAVFIVFRVVWNPISNAIFGT